MHGVAPYPLYWPLEHPRTSSRRTARFVVDFHTARVQLFTELERLHASSVVLSSNVPLRRDGLPMVPDREPTDPGVAVYFSRRKWTQQQGHWSEPRPFVIACDQYDRVRANLRAIGATIEALRTIERHGSTSMLEQAFSGFAALPPAPTAKPWREVLGFGPGPVSVEAVRAQHFALAKQHHPDLAGGSVERMTEINAAVEAAIRELARP
jgi:hypothetical protein